MAEEIVVRSVSKAELRVSNCVLRTTGSTTEVCGDGVGWVCVWRVEAALGPSSLVFFFFDDLLFESFDLSTVSVDGVERAE